MQYYLEQMKEKILFDKINEIRKAFTLKENNKDYENLLIIYQKQSNSQIIFLIMWL